MGEEAIKALAKYAPQIVGVVIVVCAFLFFMKWVIERGTERNKKIVAALDKNTKMLTRVSIYLDQVLDDKNES